MMDGADNHPKTKPAVSPGSPNALSGVRIIDLTQYEAGTSCTQALAWMGAEVIKIEPPGRGEQGRRTSAERPGIDAYYFMMLNNNKQSVTLNLKHAKGRQMLLDMIATADVFVENFGPGSIERMGFGYDVVSKINPRIVYAQIKGFDPDGPFGSFLAFDSIIQAAGGSMALTGEPDGMPVRPGVTVGDTGSGLHLAIGILGALYQRQFTGRGQRVEVAMQENMINFIRVAYAAQMESGKAVPRTGSSMPVTTAPRGFYKCKGGGMNDYVFIYTSRAGEEHFKRLLRTIGHADKIDDPRFATMPLRGKHQDVIDQMVSAWTIQHDKREVMRMIGEAGTPIGAVFDTMELSEDPSLRKRGMFVTLKHPVRGEYTVPGWPVRMSETKVPITHAPLLGADTQDVLSRLLDLTPEEVEALRADKAI